MDDATRIRRARELAGLSQAHLAREAGTRQPNVSAYESGARLPSHAMKRKLLAATGVRPRDLLAAHRDEARTLAARYGAHDLRVFGSVARGDDDLDSDVDLIARFEAGTTLIDMAKLVDALEDLLGAPVDLIDEAGLRPIDDDILADSRPL